MLPSEAPAMPKRPQAAPSEPPRPAPPGLDVLDLATRLRIAFALIARAQRRDVPERLTPVQTSALYKVETYGPIRVGDLAACEQVAGPTMCRVVTSLERTGLVTRAQDPTSARSSCVTITAAGRRQIDAVRRDRTHVLARRLAELKPDHLRALSEALPAIEALVASVTPETGLALREMQRTRRATAAAPEAPDEGAEAEVGEVHEEGGERAPSASPARARKARRKGALTGAATADAGAAAKRR